MQENNKFFLDELLFRQVHPTFIHNGRVSSQAFRPTPKDQKKLSINRGSKTTAEDCFKVYTIQRNLSSKGVWGVSVEETKTIPNLELLDDPLEDPISDPSHALIDFTEIKDAKAVGSKLAEKANFRGCLHSSPVSTRNELVPIILS